MKEVCRRGGMAVEARGGESQDQDLIVEREDGSVGGLWAEEGGERVEYGIEQEMGNENAGPWNGMPESETPIVRGGMGWDF